MVKPSAIESELIELLRGKPTEWIPPMCTRAALRVLPLTFEPFEISRFETPSSASNEVPLLFACRAAFIAWAKTRYSSHKAAGEIARAATLARTSNPNSGAAINAYFATRDALNDDMGAFARAAYAAADAATDGAETVWNSITADAKWLESNKGDPLIEQPLWLVDVRGDPKYKANFPPWSRRPFDAFEKSYLSVHGPWGMWLAWYRALLPNSSSASPASLFGLERDIEIATRDRVFWEREPRKVMADLAEMVAWSKLRNRKTGKVKPKLEFLEKKPDADLALERQPEAVVTHSAEPTRNSQPELKSPEPQIYPDLTPIPRTEAVATHSDEPTSADLLGRRPFAGALVERMDDVRSQGGSDGFAVHLHAPWGAGKRSVLLMMREMMIAKDRKSAKGEVAKPWVVVLFNAWRHARRNPPWWPLMEAVKDECLKDLWASNWNGAVWLRLRWICWRIRTDALPYIVLIFVVALSAFLLWYTSGVANSSNPYEWILKIFAAAVTAYAAFFGASRAFFGASRIAVFGSAENAKFYEDISQDPLKRIKRLFQDIVDKTQKPVCVFIDDLDRCSSDYVVDLLEGIQTSFRHKGVAYVVAADRAWIKASFETRYGAFSSAVGNVGQPLGYLFLEKVFQVSTPIPGMSDKIRAAYWNRLLTGDTNLQLDSRHIAEVIGGSPSLRGAAEKRFDSAVDSKRASLREEHGGNFTRDAADAILRTSDTAEDLAAVVLELNASRAAEKEAEHLLSKFAGIAPGNPRVMKRMINAFAMRQAIGLLEGSTTPAHVLARWTILEQRFPALADLLIEHPEWTQDIHDEVTDSRKEKLPASLLPFVNLDVIRNIIGKEGDLSLTVEHVRTITRGSAT